MTHLSQSSSELRARQAEQERLADEGWDQYIRARDRGTYYARLAREAELHERRVEAVDEALRKVG